MRIAGSVLAVLLLVPSWSGPQRLALLGDDARITTTCIPLDRLDPGRRTLGALTYLGGVALSSPDPVFGGFSALHVEGDRFTLLSDGGGIARFRMDGRWRIRDARFGQLPDGPGTGWQKRDRDSESMAVDPRTGRIWIGFERSNQIWRYAPGFARAERAAAPPAMRTWSENSGAETLIRLADGGLVAIAEGARAKLGGNHAAIRFATDPTRAPRRGFRFAYRAPHGYAPTDGVALPDGRWLILHRRATLAAGFTARLTLVDARAIRPGAVVTGRELARFEGATQRDNFEAVAITRDGADTILWIASDDNQARWMQRTLLMKFRLALPPA